MCAFRVTLKTHVGDFKQFNIACGKSPQTVKYYETSLRRFLRWAEERGVTHTADVTKKVIRSYYQHLMETSKNPASSARSVRAFFNWLHEEGELPGENPVKGAGFPKENEELVQPLSPEEVERLLAAAKKGMCPHRDVALVMLMYDTGMRVSEATGLKLEHLDMEMMQATIRRKGGRWQPLTFSFHTRRALLRYLRNERPDSGNEYVFLTRDGLRFDRYNAFQMLKRAAARAGLPPERVSPHKLRHSFAVAFLNNGGNAFHLQALLNHKTLEITKRYVNLSNRELSEAAVRFSPIASLKKDK